MINEILIEGKNGLEIIHEMLQLPEFHEEEIILNEIETYERILDHVKYHKWLINERVPYEISFRQAVYSWYENVYEPIILTIKKSNIFKYFPEKTKAELFLEVSDHYHYLTERRHKPLPHKEALISYVSSFYHKKWAKFKTLLRLILS